MRDLSQAGSNGYPGSLGFFMVCERNQPIIPLRARGRSRPVHPSGRKRLALAVDRRSGQAGFTLIELIVIIMIIGLLSVYAIPRFDYASMQVAALSRKLMEDVRYAQNRSVTTQSVHGIILSNCTGGLCTRYTLFENGDTTDPAQNPLTGEEMIIDMAGEFSGVELATALPVLTLLFEPSGTPLGGPDIGPVPLIDGANFIDMIADDHCVRLTITVTTGLISQDDDCP